MKSINQKHLFCAIFSLFIIILFSCTKDAPTVNPGDYTSGSGGITPGYYYPFVTAVYPTGAGVPVDTKFVIVFSMPVDADDFALQITATGGGAYSISPLTGASNFATITFLSQIPDLTTVTVTVGAGIHELVSGTNTPIVQAVGLGAGPSPWTFTTGTAPDVTKPIINGSVQIPASGATNVSVNTTVQLNFTEANDIDITSVNSNTFYVTLGATLIPCAPSYTAATKTVTLTPLTKLQPSQTYTVTVTTGVKDLSGNTLAAGTTWTFTTANNNLNDTNYTVVDTGTSGAPSASHLIDLTATWLAAAPPLPVTTSDYIVNTTNNMIATITAVNSNTDLTLSANIFTLAGEGYEIRRHISPTITGPNVIYMTETTADISWTTSEATSCTLSYGTGSNGTVITSLGTATDSLLSSDHSLTLNPPLSAGRRYYAQIFGINCLDSFGNAASNSTIAEFNTETNEVPQQLDINDNSQLGLNWIKSTNNSGAFMFWSELNVGNYYLYGQLVNSGFTGQWGSRKSIFTGSSTTYLSSVEDGLGGVIVLASSGASAIGSKRISSAGAFDSNWGPTADQDTDPGLSIGTGTSASAVPVYSGFITRITTGTPATEMDIPANPFYDFSRNLFTYGIVNGDYVYNTTTNNGSCATVTLSSNFRHVMGQSAGVINATNTYTIYSQTANASSPVTALDHTIAATSAPVLGTSYVGTYTCATNRVFTGHGITGVAANGNLVSSGGSFARVNAVPSTIGPLGAIYSGASTRTTTGTLEDDINLSLVQIGDYVVNTTTNLLTTASANAGYNYYVITLTNPGFSISSGATYFIYDAALSLVTSGTSSANTTGYLQDDDNPNLSLVAAGDHVFVNSPLTQVAAAGVYNYYVLGLSSGALSVINNAPYYIFDGTNTYRASGTAIGPTTGEVEDDINLSSVVNGDNIIIGKFTNSSTTIDTITSPTILTLINSFVVSAGDDYYIYNGATYIDSGTATAGSGLGILEDTTNVFTGYAGYSIIIGTRTTVSSNSHYYDFTLTNGTLTVNNNTAYNIYSNSGLTILVANGNSIGPTTGHLVNTLANDPNLGSVNPGHYIVLNSYTNIAGGGIIDYYVVSLLSGAFAFTSGDLYSIYDQYCTTHSANTNQFSSFNRIQFDWNIGITTGNTFNVYNTQRVSDTAVAPPTNPLYDNGVDLSAAANGNIALNYSAGTWATVNDTTYASAGALGLSSPIFSAVTEQYEIIAFNNGFTASNILDIGAAQGGTGSTTLVTDGVGVVGGPIVAGDIAYNFTDNDYAMITNVAGATLTLSRNAQFDSVTPDRYVIVRGTGVLYAWQSGTDIYASIRSMYNGNVITSASPLVTPNVQNPYVMPDGKGNAYLVYQTTAGQLRARLYNAALQDIWGTQDVDTQGVSTETQLKVISDGADGVLILYQYNDAANTMQVQRIRDNSGAIQRPWGTGSGWSIGNTVARDAGSAVDMVGDSTNGVIVAAKINNNIWANRVTAAGATPWVAANRNITTSVGIQQNPKIFVNGWAGNTTIVWEDDRFFSSAALGFIAGYGIFGTQVTTGAGTKIGAWNVNTTTIDQNGASIILNSANPVWPNVQIVPYNNGANASLVWEDRRYNTGVAPTRGMDMLYINLDTFTPY